MNNMREICRFLTIILFVGVAISPLYLKRHVLRWLPGRVMQ